MKRLAAFSFILICLCARADVNVLNNSSHAAGQLRTNLLALKPSGVVDVTAFVDETDTGSTFDPLILTYMLNTGRSNVSVGSGLTVNHAPYYIASNPFGGYTLSQDTSNYATMQTGGFSQTWPYTGSALPAGTQPPVLTSVVSQPVVGLTGPGSEFTMSSSYKGMDTSSPSNTTGAMSAIIIATQLNNPTWNIFDIKGALRQTAANWATGYNAANYGYGVINYDTANAISSVSNIFLQPPVWFATSNGPRLTITVYPFRSSRRLNEIVWIAPSAYSWPVKNEYTQSDLDASGGQVIYTSDGSTVPTGTVIPGVPPGNYSIAAFTADGAGNFSRIEPFSLVAVTVLKNPCLVP